MAFQSNVYVEQGLGRPGTISRMNPFPNHLPYIAEGNNVYAGNFAFEGTASGQIVGTKAGATSALGVVIFSRMQSAVTSGDSLQIREGEEVAVLLSGCAYITAVGAANKDDHVCVNPATGEITFAAVTTTPGTGALSGSIDVTQGTVSGDATVGVAAAFGADAKADVGTSSGVPEGMIDTGWTVYTPAVAGQTCEIIKI